MIKYLFIALILFCPLANADYAVGLATGMAIGSTMQNYNHMSESDYIKIEKCKLNDSTSERLACLNDLQKQHEENNALGWKISIGIIIGLIFLMYLIGRAI